MKKRMINLLKKAVFSSALVSALSFAGCSGQKHLMKQKYAVLCTGSDTRNAEEGLIDPIDKNCFWISGVNTYNELLKNGYKPKNIFVLYYDGKPPLDDEEYLDKIQEIKKEFDGSYRNIATESTLKNLLDSVENFIGPKDKFTLYLNMHGSPFGTIHFDHDHSYITGKGLTQILEGNNSREILIVTDVCHAEAFTEDISYPSTIISSSKRNFLSWGDRNFSCGSWFFEEMNNKKNDADNDGKVSPLEAFDKTKERCAKYREDMDYFLRCDYEGNGLSEHTLKHMDLVPVYRKVKKEEK